MKKSLAVVLLVALMSDMTAARPAVAQLSEEQLQRVVKDCRDSGKVATDDYCKQATFVFEDRQFKKHEAERLARVKAQGASMKTDVKVPAF